MMNEAISEGIFLTDHKVHGNIQGFQINGSVMHDGTISFIVGLYSTTIPTNFTIPELPGCIYDYRIGNEGLEFLTHKDVFDTEEIPTYLEILCFLLLESNVTPKTIIRKEIPKFKLNKGKLFLISLIVSLGAVVVSLIIFYMQLGQFTLSDTNYIRISSYSYLLMMGMSVGILLMFLKLGEKMKLYDEKNLIENNKFILVATIICTVILFVVTHNFVNYDAYMLFNVTDMFELSFYNWTLMFKSKYSDIILQDIVAVGVGVVILYIPLLYQTVKRLYGTRGK